MEQRQLGMDEIVKRCEPLYNSLNLKNLLLLPDRAVDKDDMPCILILEGDDLIDNRSGRNYLGYPCSRILNVIIECWDFSNGNIYNMYKGVREAVLVNKGILLKGVVLREDKCVGPYNLGIPNILGMRVVFNMLYKDEGPTFL